MSNDGPNEENSMHPALNQDRRHPEIAVGPAAAVYVWQYPLRMFHWGLVLSLVALAFTGYYIHNPFIAGQASRPFLMGWFRFVHEACGMLFIALFLLRFYLFFAGNRWVQWNQYLPLRGEQWREMWEVMKFYAFLRPTPVSKIGHNAIAAFSYLGIYSLAVVEIVTGLVMFDWLRQSALLHPLVGWVPRLVSIPNLRLIHFFLMYVFFAFGVFHVHLCMLISREERRGLVDSILVGYKVIPVDELDQEEEKAERSQPELAPPELTRK
jgi:Ni/Fe-hydrogenase 1 B-type cytochrome subunit